MVYPDRSGEPVAPPVPNDTAFYCRFFEQLSDIRDDGGRPLHEVEFREELMTVHTRRCPYPGSRHGRLMNAPALRLVGKEMPSIRAGLQFLVGASRLDMVASDAGVLIWARTLLPMFVPLYLLRKAHLARHSMTLPTDASALFKVMLDVSTTIDLMLARDWGAAVPAEADAYSPSAIAAYAEESGILNNSEWTCAAPPGMIADLLEFLSPTSGRQAYGVSSISDLIEPSEYEAFGLVMTRQYALSQAFQAATAFVMEHAFSLDVVDARRPHTVVLPLSAYETRRRIVLGICHGAKAAARVVNGFCDIASMGGQDDCPSGHAFRALMLEAVANAGKRTAAELLTAQLAVEETFKAAVREWQEKARAALGGGREEQWATDFSRFDRDDFPTVVLRRLVRLNHKA